MRIAWFSPFSEMSAIARLSLDVTNYLAKSCEVDVWVFETENLLQTSLPLIPYTPTDARLNRLTEYDHIIYNMGNYAGYHKPIYQVMMKHPGVVILHDFLMHNFFMQLYLDATYSDSIKDGRQCYVNDMEILYGKSGRETAERSISGIDPIWLSEDVLRFPFFQKVTSLATGIFVHSRFHRRQVQKYFAGPVENAYLPFSPDEKLLENRPFLRKQLFAENRRLMVVSTGIVHPCKRIHSVIEILGEQQELRDRISYFIIGQSGGPYKDHLIALIKKYGLLESVFMMGYQPYDTMYQYLASADFCVNLRFPNSEGCSLSLIEQMAYENPVVSLNTGMYEEIPPECTLKVRLKNEKQDLRSAFNRLATENETRQLMSKAAANWTKRECTITSYCNRLINFLTQLPDKTRHLRPAELAVGNVARALVSIGFDVGHFPLLTDQVSKILEEVLCKKDNSLSARVVTQRVLGIWLGFEIAVGLRREGITRYLVYLIKHLVDNYHITCEIWCYAINYDEIQIGFAQILDDIKYSDYVKVIHEQNYEIVFGLEEDPLEVRQRADPELDDLAVLVNRYSRAECFLAGICYLDNLLSVDRPLFVPVHDLVLHERYYDFLAHNPNSVLSLTKVRKSLEGFHLRGAFFYSNSDYVRRNHLLKYFPEIKNCAFVYLPANVPPGIEQNIPAREKIYDRYGIKGRYLFYPTQLRPHKNLQVLLRALNHLVLKRFDVKLVLTGNLEDSSSLKEYMRENGLQKYVILVGDVPENDLYGLHYHAAATVVTTYFEGGFPWQALEGLAMNTPVILSRIQVVEERLLAVGLDPETCGLLLFDPRDYIDLADKIMLALADRERQVKNQEKARTTFLTYTWDDVSHQCYKMFFGDLNGSTYQTIDITE